MLLFWAAKKQPIIQTHTIKNSLVSFHFSSSFYQFLIVLKQE